MVFSIILSMTFFQITFAETSTEKAIREAKEQGIIIAKSIETEIRQEIENSKGKLDVATFFIIPGAELNLTVTDSFGVKHTEYGQGNKKINIGCAKGKSIWIYSKMPTGGFTYVIIHNGKMSWGMAYGDTFNQQASCWQEHNDTEEKIANLSSSIINSKVDSIKPKFTEEWINQDIRDQAQEDSNKIKDHAMLLIYSDSYWSGNILDSSLDSATIDGERFGKIPFICTKSGVYSIVFQRVTQPGYTFSLPSQEDLEASFSGKRGTILTVAVIQDGKLLDGKTTASEFGVVSLAGKCQPAFSQEFSGSPQGGGGCLIATATYGSELAPQVQQLRELRDNSLLQTESGTSFMRVFNQFYYSFSPTMADWERESPAFKEFVKITLTPMISSLSILNYVDMDSEASVLGYGVSLILLNVGMYFVAPTIVIVGIRKKSL